MKKNAIECSLLNLILEAAGEGILGLNLQGQHTFVNPAAARMLGYDVKELIGKPSHSIWHHTKHDGSHYPQEECPIYAAYQDGKVHRSSAEVFWRKNGSSFAVEYSSTPIFEDEKLIGAVVTFMDITDRKQIKKEREKLIKDLKEALANVKTLSGMLPICAWCKKIRDDKGYWNQVDAFVSTHTNAQFSHGLCPECGEKAHEDVKKFIESRTKKK